MSLTGMEWNETKRLGDAQGSRVIIRHSTKIAAIGKGGHTENVLRKPQP
jgi:hypothetical protein